MCIRDRTNNVDAAAYLGTVIAKRALEKGITEVVFDRGGYKMCIRDSLYRDV